MAAVGLFFETIRHQSVCQSPVFTVAVVRGVQKVDVAMLVSRRACTAPFACSVLVCALIGTTSGVRGAPSDADTAIDTRAASAPCLNIYHDEVEADDSGPINAIMLANLLGHWPHYEIRVRPIASYTTADLETCKSTIYLGTSADTDISEAFLADFLGKDRLMAWVGFGQNQLNQHVFAKTFGHVVSGQFTIDDTSRSKTAQEDEPGFFQHVAYKDRLFRKSVERWEGEPIGAFAAVRFVPTNGDAKNKVLANLIHNKTYQMTPYILRAGKKFVVGDIPFSYMHEADRYFVFADVLFDILDEEPVRSQHLAFSRTEDIHGFYELRLLEATLSAHIAENVPFSITHIPLFADPFNSYGSGVVATPVRADTQANFLALVRKIAGEERNAIIWHGVTHQYGARKNPHSGTSGDDYEFWDMVANRPIGEDSVRWTLDRLAQALPVFEAYNIKPRYWVTPHYHASAVNARTFAEVIPWQVGRMTYYPSSFGATFTIPAADRTRAREMPSVDRQRLEDLKGRQLEGLDNRSQSGLTQMFPYEIYRDVYGQRILPETLGYLSYATSEQTAFIRTVDDMLADARRNQVIRDYWASFFYHPYIFASKEDGGIGRFAGDTLELRKLLAGLKLLGFQFTGLSEFEASVTKGPDRFGSLGQPSQVPN